MMVRVTIITEKQVNFSEVFKTVEYIDFRLML